MTMMRDLHLDFSSLHPRWFLVSLEDRRSSVRYRGAHHIHIDWRVTLQHVTGGHLIYGEAATPTQAFEVAIAKLEYGLSNGQWTNSAELAEEYKQR